MAKTFEEQLAIVRGMTNEDGHRWDDLPESETEALTAVLAAYDRAVSELAEIERDARTRAMHILEEVPEPPVPEGCRHDSDVWHDAIALFKQQLQDALKA